MPHPTHLTDPLHIARFWSKVDVGRPGVCWPWRAATNEHGYGVFRLPEVHTLVMAAKGRSKGIQHSRLTQSQVEEIKARCAAGEPQASIAADLSVAQSYVSMVNAGKRLPRKEIA